MSVEIAHHVAALSAPGAVRHRLFGARTNDLTPLLGGTAEPNCMLLVGLGGAVFSLGADAAGQWELDTRSTRPLYGRFDLRPDGDKSLTVTSFDAHGHSRAIHGMFTVDTEPPPVPTLDTCRAREPRPRLSGQAEAGCSVMLGVGGAVYLVGADADGHWNVDTACDTPYAGSLHLDADGPQPVVLACIDEAGNTSSAEASFVLDTSAAASAFAEGARAWLGEWLRGRRHGRHAGAGRALAEASGSVS